MRVFHASLIVGCALAARRAVRARIWVAAGAMCLLPALSAAGGPPRLVLQITVDGLRADLLSRGADRFGEGGFRFLLELGTVYANAHYRHANTETIVGHATLATGAQPSAHGMTGNVWYDGQADELADSIEDPDHPLLPTRESEQSGDQLDPAQRLARTKGRSPRALPAETFADKLLSYTGGRAKVHGVSGKDRGAVSMAGRGGTAYWYSTDSGDFVTSTWYGDAYPDWVVAWNAARHTDEHSETRWTLLNDAASYRLAHQDDRPYETDLRGYGRVFPHRFAAADNPLSHTQILVSPVGDQLGSPWSYDTHVPVIFAGPGIQAGVVFRPVQPADVAPTLVALLGMSPPASAQGTVLREVLGTAP